MTQILVITSVIAFLAALYLAREQLGRLINRIRLGAPVAPPFGTISKSQDTDRCIADLLPMTNTKLAVLTGEQLLKLRDVRLWLTVIEKQSGLLHESFKRDCEPVLIAVAEYVQLLPASQSHHHANPGGLLIHLLESAAFAVSIRKSRTLPVNAPVETIAKRQHRWTYAVFIASLLHDIGKPLADLDVKMHIAQDLTQWNPLTTTMPKLGATHYEVSFATTRNYYLHEKLPILFLKSIVPEASLQWLAQDPDCFNELTQFLSRDRSEASTTESTAQTSKLRGAIEEIITLADQKSVAQNLLTGSRSRFNTATEAPLIEKLVTGLREMLQQQLLPLNRAGAAGWIYEGDLWIAGKRLADELRGYLIDKNIKGIPGADKNDRIFDTFQEYGFLVRNPINNRSIWHAKIEQDDGWSYTLTVLRFPLNKVYLDLAAQPLSMMGKITVLADKHGEPNIEKITTVTESSVSHSVPLEAIEATESEILAPIGLSEAPKIQSTLSTLSGNGAANVIEALPDPMADLNETIATTLGLSVSDLMLEKPLNKLKGDDGFFVVKKPVSTKALIPAKPRTHNASITAELSQQLSTTPFVDPFAAQALSITSPAATTTAEVLYLPENETAKHDKSADFVPVSVADIPQQQNTKPAHNKPEKVKRTLQIAGQAIELLAPVSPSVDRQIVKLSGPVEPPEAAVAFMRWLQEGIVSGDIQINQSIAQVHFVQLSHPAISKGETQSLMLLVTPLCFRDFAESNPSFGDSKTVQTAFLKAKWHLTAEPGNINILRFKTPGNNNGTPKLLSCIGVKYPEKFVNPVPGSNELLKYDDAMTRQFMTKPKDQKSINRL